MNYLAIGDRQHNAILSAIQLWQKISLEHPELVTDEIRQTAAGPEVEPLSYEEMNTLCRGINDGVNCLNNEFRTMAEGFAVMANHLDFEPAHTDIIVFHDAAALFLNAATSAGLACGDLVLVEPAEEVSAAEPVAVPD